MSIYKKIKKDTLPPIYITQFFIFTQYKNKFIFIMSEVLYFELYIMKKGEIKMKVRELIERLKQFDPEKLVCTQQTDEYGTDAYVLVDKVRLETHKIQVPCSNPLPEKEEVVIIW